MRERLLRPLGQCSKLHKLLVLFTLLLTLPLSAWGTTYTSGTLNGNTWGDWTLSSGPSYQGNDTGGLGFSGASTITLTLTRPANTTDLIKDITLEIGDGITNTTLQSAMMGNDNNITSSFTLNNGVYTYSPTIPAEWSGDIVITLQRGNDQGSILGAYVRTVSYYGITIGGIPVTSDNATAITGDKITGTVSYDLSNSTLTLNNATINNIYDIGITSSITGTLDINLVGNNTILCGDKKAFALYNNVQFTTDTNNPGQMTVTRTISSNTQDIFSGSGSATYGNSLVLSRLSEKSVLISTTTAYGITVAGTSVTSANASNVLNDDYSSVSYNAATSTLTLKGVDLTSATNKNISATSALTIHLLGYSNVGEIYVNEGTNNVNLTFTTNETLPGFLKYTNMGGNFDLVRENGLSWDDQNKLIKPGSTNPYIIYASGSYDNGDISGYNNAGDQAYLDVSPDVAFVSSTNNTDIKYFKVSSSSQSCYIYPGNLDDMNLVTKAYLLFDWGTCTNKSVKVQVRGLTDNFITDGTYSDEVSLPSDGGLVEIPLNGTINSYYFQLYFSSSAGEFSFIPISVGFLKDTSTSHGYELYIDGTRVTTGNASDILTGTNAGKVSYNAADNILTLSGASLTNIRTELSGLKINLTGTNTIVASDSAAIQRAIPENNDNGTAITLSFNGTGNLTITKKLITGNTYYSSINNHITVSYNDGLVSEDGTSTTRISKGYNLTIAGTTVTELNAPDVFGDSKVSFTPASSGNNNTNILTLNGVSFNNSIISNLDNLTILIQGDNDLANDQSGASGYISSTNTNAPLILKGGTGDCTLRLDDDYGNAVISGFASVTYDGVYLSTSRAAKYVTGTGAAIKDLDGDIVQLATITTTHYYPLWVNSIQVYEGIKDDIFGDSQNSAPISATFAPVSNTLTLNGVSIDSSNGIESGLNSLTINLKGNNSINTNTTAYYSPICSMEAVPLTIQKATDATNCELRLGSAFDVPQVVKGFSSVSHPSLNFVSKTGSTIADATTKDALLSSSAIYPLWVAGTMVTESASSGTGWSYDGNTNTLTLDDYTSTFDGHAFAINMPNLNVYLKGTNTVGYANIIGYQAFYSYYTDATLTFSTDENNMGKLDASYYATFCDGFKVDNNIHCIYCNNGLGYYPSDRKIEAKKTPTIKFVVRDQTAGSIPASQSDYVYVPDNGIQIPYAASYYAPKPVFSDDYLLSDSTRYEYTMSVDGVVEFALSSTPSGNPGKIDYANDGKVNILKSGELTITCTFPGNLQNKPCSASYTLKITRDFNNPFGNNAEQIYATYYNGYEDLALPDGIVAYVVTGISGNTVTTTATGYLPHDETVLLEKTGTVGTKVTGYSGSAGNFSANLLKKGPASTAADNEKYYVLYNNEFVKAVGYILADHNYLDLSSVNPSRGMYSIGDGSTGIHTVNSEEGIVNSEVWFDMQGRRIDKPTRPGLYIKNGKKVVVNNK